MHLQRNPTAFPLQQLPVVRNVCTYSETRMCFRYTSLCSAECVHLQRNPNAFPLHQPSVVRNVCTYSKTRMRFRYTSPLWCEMCALTAKSECVDATATLCSAECMHLQQHPNSFPLHQPSILRNVRTYSKIRMHFRHTHVILCYV